LIFSASLLQEEVTRLHQFLFDKSSLFAGLWAPQSKGLRLDAMMIVADSCLGGGGDGLTGAAGKLSTLQELSEACEPFYPGLFLSPFDRR
jgi:hypothetical protein